MIPGYSEPSFSRATESLPELQQSQLSHPTELQIPFFPPHNLIDQQFFRL
jgi:hypothetical protein